MKQFFISLCLFLSLNLYAQSDTIYTLTVLRQDSLMTFKEFRSYMSYEQLVFLLETVYHDAIKEKEEAEKKSKRTNAKKSQI